MKARRLLVLLAFGVALAVLVPAPALAERDSDRSEINEVHVSRVEALGTFGETRYERLVGTVSGRVSADELVAGLDTVVDDGAYHYTSGFELIRPVRPGRRSEVVVEAENRGSPLMLRDLNSFNVPAGAPQDVTYSPGLGNGFLFNDGRSYARVQWQTGISPGVPESAQGVGQIIVRDFGRLLRDGALGGERSVLGAYRHRLLVGLSQSSWFVTSFVAEGFNNAGGRVYQGAYAQDGLGNQLALNGVAEADGGPQVAYVRPDGAPLTPEQVLHRPKTDPVFVDVATYTDYYRLRASVSRQAGAADGYHRYDWPGAHAPSRGPATADRAFNQLRCNDGEVIPLNPIDTRPYARALLVALERRLGIEGAAVPMPQEGVFTAGAEPSDAVLFNGLPDREASVPHVDRDGFPLAGVRYPAADLPLGSPVPPVLTPVSTDSITAVCGNFGGWRPYSARELRDRYHSLDSYLAAYDALAVKLVKEGLLLDADRQVLLGQAAAEWSTAPADS